MAREYEPEEKRRAIELGSQIGPAEAGRRLGIPIGSIKGWMNRAGVTPVPRPEGPPAPRPAPRAKRARRPERPKPLRIVTGPEPVTVTGPSVLAEPGTVTPVNTDPDAETKARLERFRVVNQIATEASRAARTARREHLRDLMLERAIWALERIDKPHVDFKGKDATQVTYPVAPASAVQAYATAAAILVDKYRLEAGESTSNTEVVIRARVERIAAELGLKPDDLLAETRRLLTEGVPGDGEVGV